MSNKKKAMLTTLAATLAASTALTGLPAAEAAFHGKAVPELSVQKPKVNVPERLQAPENPKEVVRVIVEVEGEPTITAATKEGVNYKDLSESKRASLESAVQSRQADVQQSIKKAIGEFKVEQSFTTVFNGFSLEVKAGDVAKLALTPGVTGVYESTEYSRPEVEPEMISSKELVQAQLAWDKYQYKGEGMVVGVIDSGIDPNHKDFVLTDDATGEITSDEVDAALTSGEVEAGKYFSAKVPFGYNYMDDNYEVRDIGPGASMHGQHVSGTVGANGDESNGGIKGVAPEAQILALKVFGNDVNFGSTFGDIYIKAIDDAIKLGADVLNMSLGATAGYVDSSNPEQMAVARAKDNGIIVSISAGNSNLWGGDGGWYPGANNQDYGLTGSPSVSEGSLGVASIENDTFMGSAVTYSVNDGEGGQFVYLNANEIQPTLNTEFEIVDAGLGGTAADFEGKDFTGKYAFIQRGSFDFVTKAKNAQAAGAAGVIIYNNQGGIVNMATDPSITIPQLFMLQEDGNALKAELTAGNKVEIMFDGSEILAANPEKGMMSSFTSWGPTPNLDFKPEITAPGGNIYSTFNDDQYGMMSGTSMASPHVAGGSALVFQRVDEFFPELSGYERSQFAKLLLMNTSKPVELNAGEYVSPRRQGAGLMQLANALETDVVVYDKATGEGKVALKEIDGGKFQLNLEAKNFSDTEKTYNVSIQLQSDMPINGGAEFVVIPNDARYGSYVFASTGDEVDYTVEIPATVTVPANGVADVTVDVDASASEWLKDYFENGYFIDGFVTLTDSTPEEGETENLPSLTVPFFGFNGSWDDAPIFDDEFWKKATTYYGVQGLYTSEGLRNDGKWLAEGAIDPSTFAFSPNEDGVLEDVLPVFSLERNAKEFEVNVLDKDGKKLRTIATSKDLRKHFTATQANPYTFNPMYAWDGTIAGKPAAEGEYQIELRAVIDFPGAEWQSVKYPVKLDTQAPSITPEVSADQDTATFTVGDNLSGINYVAVVVDGETVAELNAVEDKVADFDLSKYDVGTKVTFEAYDVAGNKKTSTITVDNAFEEGFPVIDWSTPGFFDVFGEADVEFKGKVTDESKVVEVTVNGEVADAFDGTNFTHTLTFEDGLHKVKVAAKDQHGNVSDIQRQIFVDTTAPSIDVEGAPATVAVDAEDPTVAITVEDNFDYARVYLNGSEIHFQDLSEPYSMTALDKTLDVTLDLEEGENEFEVKVVDLAGHETVKNFTVTKADELPLVTFDDIQDHWAKEQIEALASRKIVYGKTTELFSPDTNITRAEFAVLIARALELPTTSYKGTFSDVPITKDWAYAGIEAAAAAGIVSGKLDGTFKPDAKITREEIAAMTMRAVKYENPDLLDGVEPSHVFADQAKIGAFALESVQYAYALEVVYGRAGNKFDPKANATRAESSVMLYRVLDAFGEFK